MTMWIFNRQKQTLLSTAAAALLLLGGCGMAEGDDEDRNSRIYLTFDDVAFEEFCLARYDLNGDGRFSRHEAQRVLHLDCSGLGITSLALIDEFKHLETLNCANNALTDLDVKACRSLRTLDCTNNRLGHLEVEGLRSLTVLRCAENELTNLNVGSNVNLEELQGEQNRFTVLDLSSCAASLRAWLRNNPSLKTIYYRTGQQIDYASPATLVER